MLKLKIGVCVCVGKLGLTLALSVEEYMNTLIL